MTIIQYISDYCKRRNLTVDDIIEPKSDLACTVRDNLISVLAHMRGLQASEIKHFLNVEIHYVKEKLRP